MTELLFTTAQTKLLSMMKTGSEDQKAYLDIHRMIGARTVPIDRSNTITSPIKYKSIFGLPDLTTYTNNKSFADLCDARASELHQYSRNLNKPLLVMYSGGIDSTTLLAALIKNAPNNDMSNVKVFLNTYSIRENPSFYYNQLLGKVTIIPSENINNYINDDNILVSGEGADQLFGTDLFFGIDSNFGYEYLDTLWTRKTVVPVFVNLGLNEYSANIWFNVMADQIASSEYCDIKTVRDFFWWYNFCYKWQTVYFRLFATLYKSTSVKTSWIQDNYRNFFMTDDFQCWSVLNPDVKYHNTVEEYKYAAKEYIFEIDQNQLYLDYKIKVKSLPNLMMQQSHHGGLDSNYNFLKPFFNIEPYINHENTFKDAIADYKR